MNKTRTAMLALGFAALMGVTQPATAQWPVSGIMSVKNANTGAPVYLATVFNDYGEVATDVNGQFWALMYPSEHFLASANGYTATHKYLTLAEANSRYAEIFLPPVVVTPTKPVGQEHLIMAAPVFGLLAGVAAYRRKLSAGL